MRVKRIFSNKSVYVFYQGNLNECKLKRTYYKKHEDKNEWEAFKNTIEINGSEIDLDMSYMFYSSPENYLNKMPICYDDYYFLHKEQGFYWDEDVNDVVKYDAYKDIQVLYYDYTTNNIEIEVGFYPEDLFRNEEDVRKYYPIAVKHLDNTTTHIGGELTCLLLNDEQKELLREFKQLLHKMKDANLAIVLDDGHGYAFNSSNIDRVGSVYDDCEHNLIFLERNRVKEMEYNFGVYLDNWGDGVSADFKKQ